MMMGVCVFFSIRAKYNVMTLGGGDYTIANILLCEQIGKLRKFVKKMGKEG